MLYKNFAATFESGLTRLEALLASGARTLAGADAFMLHDTYGFPIELTQEIASERSVAVDAAGFEREMEAQRTRARAASKFEKGGDAGARAAWTVVSEGPHSSFTGYDSVREDLVTLRRWRSGPAGALELVLDRTPLYAESGGQVADRGTIEGDGVRAELSHVYKEDDAIVHRVALRSGTAEALVACGVAGRLAAIVDTSARQPTIYRRIFRTSDLRQR